MSDVRIDFVERAQSAVALYPPPAPLSLAFSIASSSFHAFYNAVDTHDHSKELDDDAMAEKEKEEEMEEEEEEEEEEREEREEVRVRDFSSSIALVKYFLRRLARFAWLRYYDCRKFRGGREGERKRDRKGEREREREREREGRQLA